MTPVEHPDNIKADILSPEEYDKRLAKKLDEAFIKTEKSIIGFFIKNFRFTYLILFAMIGVGIFSLLTLPKEADPEIIVPFAVVTTIYPGANPNDTEELITDKIEKEIKNLDNLKIYTSSSGAGLSSIFVEFEASADLQESFRKLREAVNNAEPKLPSDAETPFVGEINFNDIPIVTYSLVGDYSDTELKNLADLLQEELESIPDVSRADILGGLEQEFQVIVDEQKLINYNISLNQISNAIRSANFSLPAGDIVVDGFKYNVRVKGRFSKINELENTVIATYENSPVLLSDLAEIKDTYKEKNTISKIGFANQDSKNTISLQIRKKTGGNILNIVKNANAKIEEIKTSGKLPNDLIIEKTNDNSVFIKEDIGTLGTNGIQTMIIITIILLLILSWQGAFITALSVPFAFLNAFIFLKLQGLTLNSMVLFSLVLSLGLMVDNSIVVIEGINEYVNKHKKSIYEAAILSVWNYKWAITAGTMTSVAAFLPMLLVSGILGQYMATLPKTITVTLLSSLFVALVIIPTLAVRFIKIKNQNGEPAKKTGKKSIIISKFSTLLFAKYRAYLQSVLPFKKKRRRILAISWIIFFISLAIPFSGLMNIEMFPKIDIDFFSINIEAPIGSSLDSTSLVVDEVEKIVKEIPELDNYVISIGASAASGFAGDTGSISNHLAGITVNLLEKDLRKRTSYEITDSLRDSLNNIQGAKVNVDELSAGPPTGAPIEIRISGEDNKQISQITGNILGFLKNQAGVINAKDNLENAAGEFSFEVDKQKANYYGLDILSIASTLRNAIYGSTAGTVNVDGDDVDITIKYNKSEFTTINDLSEVRISTKDGQIISMKELAKASLEPALLSINHRNGKKTAIVTADIEKGYNLPDVLSAFDEYQKSLDLPNNYNISVGGEVEDIQKSFTELFMSMLLAVLLIAIILVLQFNSFKQALIIIFTVPLAIIGVIFGLNALLMPFSFLAFIGIVSLAGIAVNDSIVLIDKINKNIADGMEFIESIINAGISRMQPIFLTTITTIAGIMPLYFTNEMWQGFSVALISGLIFSTFLTLLVIPLYYAGICRKDKCKNLQD